MDTYRDSTELLSVCLERVLKTRQLSPDTADENKGPLTSNMLYYDCRVIMFGSCETLRERETRVTDWSR
jgi:hypothetical protein